MLLQLRNWWALSVRPVSNSSVRPVVLLLSYLTDCRLQDERAHAARGTQMGAFREGDPEPESTGGQADDAQGRGGEGGVDAFAKKISKWCSF